MCEGETGGGERKGAERSPASPAAVPVMCLMPGKKVCPQKSSGVTQTIQDVLASVEQISRGTFWNFGPTGGMVATATSPTGCSFKTLAWSLELMSSLEKDHPPARS